MLYARLRSLLPTLRFRLTAWNTLVLLVAVLVALVAVREGLRLALVAEIDRLLEEDTLELALAVKSYYPNRDEIHREMARKAEAHVDRKLFVQLLDEHGKIGFSSRGTPAEFDRFERSNGASLAPNLVRRMRGGGYLAAERPLEDGDLPQWTIRVGCSDEHVHQDLGRLTATMTLVGLFVLIVAPLGGFWLAGRATRPLAEINRTAADLHPTQLDERLAVRGSGDELDQLSRTINGLLDRIAAYVARNQDFIANAAHELRSPLAAIQSSAEVALERDRTCDEYQDLLGEIVNDCGHLGSLVNQLLLLAESDAGELHADLEVVAFDEVVARSVEMFRGAVEEQGLTLVLGPCARARVRGDAKRLRQVVNNVLDNAVKFTPQGGRVSVGLNADIATGLATLTVRDTGAGISAADLPQIFERFFRGDKSRQRRFRGRGTGLGLAICQAIVSAHRGEIRVDSRPGEGTEVRVILPLFLSDGVLREGTANVQTRG